MTETAPPLDDATRLLFAAEGYLNLKILSNGEMAGTHRYLFTCAIVIGIDFIGWRTRYCYGTEAEAAEALRQWDGIGDPPGLWMKQKPEERLGPGASTKKGS